MKKALIVALIAVSTLSSSAYAANTKDGCYKTFWNSKFFAQIFGVGQCKG